MIRYFITFIVALAACSSPVKDSRLLKIEGEINKNAMGVDIGYIPGKLDTVLVLRSKPAIADLEQELQIPVSSDWDKAIQSYTGVYEKAQKENDGTTYHIWKWEVERMKKLRAMRPDEVDFSVYKYTYQINNQLQPKAGKTEVIGYYFFNKADSLIGKLGSDQISKLKKEFVQSNSQPYRVGLMELETGVDDL